MTPAVERRAARHAPAVGRCARVGVVAVVRVVLAGSALYALCDGAAAQYGGGPSGPAPSPFAPAPTPGQEPRRTFIFQPTIGVEETFTTNANFDRGSLEREADAVTIIRPGFVVNYESAHARLAGTVALPVFYYARTNNTNSRVLPEANVAGTLEAWERYLWVDAAINVSQQYLSPFGPRPTTAVSVSENRYTAQSYLVSPYTRGELPNGLTYELRDNNVWSVLSNTPAAVDNAYTNQLIGRLDRAPSPLGWGVDLLRSSVLFTGQDKFVTELIRARGVYKPDPQLELTVSGGYENNDYAFTKYKGPIYGIGARWRPGERTSLDARWEHRFFGSSYYVSFDHRTALTVWNVRVSRDATSFPEQIASLAAGTNVLSLLDSLFSLRVPDPALRQQLVDQFMRERGLPTFTSDPVRLYTQQISLVQSASATVGLIGVRNTLFVNAFYSKNESITAAGTVVPIPTSGLTNNTQTGGSIVWTHNLSPLLVLTTTLDYLHTQALPPQTVRTEQGAFTMVLSRPISPRTSVHAGARYQSLRSDIRADYEESAIFVGFDHRFN